MICRWELETIYQNLRPTIVEYLITCLHLDACTAEDIYHEGCLRFWRSYDRSRKPLNLMVEITKNLAINHQQKHVNCRTDPIPDLPAPEEPQSSPNTDHLLKHYSGRHYTILRLIQEGYSYADIAETLGMSRRRLYGYMRHIRAIGRKLGRPPV